jgi:hypothetical protein
LKKSATNTKSAILKLIVGMFMDLIIGIRTFVPKITRLELVCQFVLNQSFGALKPFLRLSQGATATSRLMALKFR